MAGRERGGEPPRLVGVAHVLRDQRPSPGDGFPLPGGARESDNRKSARDQRIAHDIGLGQLNREQCQARGGQGQPPRVTTAAPPGVHHAERRAKVRRVQPAE